MNLKITANIIKKFIEKEFFIYPYKKIEELYQIVLRKQAWFNNLFIQFIEGDGFLNGSPEYQESLLYNFYSEIKMNNKFKILYHYHILLIHETPSKSTLEQLDDLVLWLKKEKFKSNILLVNLSSLNVQSIHTGFEDKEGIASYMEENLPHIQEDFSEINFMEIERKVKLERGYYVSETSGKLTKLIMTMNVLLFLYMSYNGGTTDIYNLIRFGAKYNPLIADGEYYRLVSNMFIHIGVLHLLLNSYALKVLGKDVKEIYGSVKMLFIYLLSGVFGGLGSFIFSRAVSAGASGAIFGLIGSYLYFGFRKPLIFSSRYGMNLITLLVINIIFGLSNSTIDNFAHLGGLMGGFLTCWAIGLKGEKIYSLKKLFRQGLVILLVIGLLVLGVYKNQNTWEYHLHRGVKYLQQDNLQRAKHQFEQGLKTNQNVSDFYFYLAYIYYFEGNREDAIKYLNKTLLLNPADEMARNFLNEITEHNKESS